MKGTPAGQLAGVLFWGRGKRQAAPPAVADQSRALDRGDELSGSGEIAQVTLRRGHVCFDPSSYETDAEIDGDLTAGQVTATSIRLRE